MGIELNSQQTLTMNSCDLGTKSSLGLNCYFTAVYISTKPTLGAAPLVPPMLLVILHMYTHIQSISTVGDPDATKHSGERTKSPCVTLLLKGGHEMDKVAVDPSPPRAPPVKAAAGLG